MGLAEKQRNNLYKEKGNPKLTLEFDVYEENEVHMWTHLNHGEDFFLMKKRFEAISEHLKNFLADENLCPFHKQELNCTNFRKEN